MYCRNCGKKMDNEEYCKVCGTPSDIRLKCSKCGAVVKEYDFYCAECGTDLRILHNDIKEVPEIKEIKDPIRPEDERRRAGTLFCKYCGIKRVDEKSPCSKCGSSADIVGKYCGKCGKKLNEYGLCVNIEAHGKKK